MDSLTLLLTAGAGLAAGAFVVAAARAWPRGALWAGYLLVLLAGTKYRQRPPHAALSAAIDLQVVYELALYAIVALIVVTAVVRLRPALHRPTVHEGLLLAFGLFAVASITWSAVPRITMVRASQYLVLLGLASVSLRALGWDAVRRALTGSLVLYVLAFSAIEVAILTLPHESLGPGWTSGRFHWFQVHPITVGTLAGAALVMLLAEALFVPRGRWLRVAGAPLMAVWPALLLVLMSARSRGPIFATVVACVFLVFRRVFQPWLAALATVGTVLVAGALIAVNASELFAGWIQESEISDNPAIEFLVRGDSVRYLMTLGGRTLLWNEVAALFEARPLLGWGYSASRGVLLARVPWASYAHNALLQTLLDVGLVGTALLWIVLLRSLFREVLKPRWAGLPQGDARGFVFGALLFLFALSILSETFAGPPGYELLLVLACALVSEKVRIPPASRPPGPSAHGERANVPSTSWPYARHSASVREPLRQAK